MRRLVIYSLVVENLSTGYCFYLVENLYGSSYDTDFSRSGYVLTWVILRKFTCELHDFFV